MGNLLAAAAVFALLHRGISGSPLRGFAVRRLGETAYGRLFQLATVAVLAWLGSAYAAADHGTATEPVWSVHPLFQQAQLIAQPLALLLAVTGVSTPNPGTFRQEAVVERPDAVRGMLRVTRHPFLWGVALFAAGHLLAAPSPRNLVLFGTMLVVALTGTASIDAKRRRRLGPRWAAFVAQTSNVPFGAILAGRQRLRPGELGWSRIGATIALSLALTFAHPLFRAG